MKDLRVADDIISVTELVSQAEEVLDRLRGGGGPVLITQNGSRAGVLLSIEDFNRLHFMTNLAQGLADAAAGRVMDTAELNRKLDEEFGGYADFED